ncbi:MAG: hypothetical protein C4346_02790 [Chloroflexota bacterium]
MQLRSAKLLSDIQRSCSFIIEQASTRTLEDYEQNLLVRSAIERHFEIIGEALIRLTRSAPETVGQISNASQIIGFRHRLAHGYDDLDSKIVWEIIQRFVPILRDEVEYLLTVHSLEATEKERC